MSKKNSLATSEIKVTKTSEKNNSSYTKYSEDFSHLYNGSPEQMQNMNQTFHNNIIMHASDSIETISSKVS